MDYSTQVSLSVTNSWSLLKLMAIEVVMPSNHHILCHLLLLPLSIFPSIRVFSKESVLHIRWPKYWSFSFSISPSNEGNQDWFPLGWTGWISLLSKGLTSLLQHHSSKASIIRCSAFFIVQLSHPYMTTGKTIALTTWTFVSKVMSLLLSRFAIAILPIYVCRHVDGCVSVYVHVYIGMCICPHTHTHTYSHRVNMVWSCVWYGR